MTDRTCGQGLAENAALPGKLAGVGAAFADTLEAHMKTLEIADDDARAEHDAYARLVHEFRTAADELTAASVEMAAARDMPMGKHHHETGPSSELLEAFERLVKVKRELMAWLTSTADQDQEMLVRMATAAASQR